MGTSEGWQPAGVLHRPRWCASPAAVRSPQPRPLPQPPLDCSPRSPKIPCHAAVTKVGCDEATQLFLLIGLGAHTGCKRQMHLLSPTHSAPRMGRAVRTASPALLPRTEETAARHEKLFWQHLACAVPPVVLHCSLPTRSPAPTPNPEYSQTSPSFLLHGHHPILLFGRLDVDNFEIDW